MKRLIPILAIAIVALAVAGCGSSKTSSSSTSTTPAASSGGGGGGQTLKISADPNQLKYNTTSLSAKAGTVTISMSNAGSLSHDVSIKGGGVTKQGSVVGSGGTSTVTADLKAGTPNTGTYAWDFGDAGAKYNALRGFNAAHLYEQPGTYTIKLTLTNSAGDYTATGVAATDAAAAGTVERDGEAVGGTASPSSSSSTGASGATPRCSKAAPWSTRSTSRRRW